MPSALLVLGGGARPPPVADDLSAAGIAVLESGTGAEFAQNLVAHAPDLVIVHQDWPDDALFDAVSTVGRLAPRPVIVFTLDPDADNIARAMTTGVHAYIIDGYGATRLRSVIHLARARFQRDRKLRDELADVNQRFEERKLIDRAKGILMGARQLREEEAYRALRRVAMDSKQRIGQVSQRVIDSARYGEAVNRAGQLRMLSQRLVKLYALAASGIHTAPGTAAIAASAGQIDDTLAVLGRTLSKATFGDLIEAVAGSWGALKRLLQQSPRIASLGAVDAAAEAVLSCSEQLTDNLEVGGLANGLRVINVAGRQRMLSQRLAKATLLAGSLDGLAADAAAAQGAAAAAALADGLGYLRGLPLSNAVIAADIAAATQNLAAMLQTIEQPQGVARLERIAELSETLLDQFDRLTTHYERAMQAFVDG